MARLPFDARARARPGAGARSAGSGGGRASSPGTAAAAGAPGAGPGARSTGRPRGEPDAALVQRVRAGERECYSTLVRRHQETLYRHARGMGLDHDTALDLTQDALVKAYTALDGCDPARFRAWLLRILRNRCLDHLKNVRRSNVRLEDAGADGDVAQSIPPAAGDDVRESVTSALDTLPELLREAFLLKHLHGYSYDEMADISGASVSAMKMRVHRAREALRAELGDEGRLAM